MLLSLWFYCCLFVVTLFSGMGIIFFSFLDSSGRIVHRIGWLWGQTMLAICGIKLSVQGQENLTPGQPYVFAANHQSQFDIFVIHAGMPCQFQWLAKAELFKVPFFGEILRRQGSVSIDRSNPQAAIRSLNRAADRIKAGSSILIFPEGTRGATGQLLPFKKGGLTLAIKSGQPLVPVSISGTRFIQPRSDFRIHPGPIKVVIGRPIETSQYGPTQKNQLMAVLREAIQRNYDPDYPHNADAGKG
jgi:1-acyl-sn-glycerol-3-phosphate acyltransferase